MLRRGVFGQAARCAATMAPPRNKPSNPLVVILGSTGTGKSDVLFILLASLFHLPA